MAIIGLDTFTGIDDTPLINHIPDIGGGWTPQETENLPTATVIGNNQLSLDLAKIVNLHVYTLNIIPPNDYSVQMNIFLFTGFFVCPVIRFNPGPFGGSYIVLIPDTGNPNAWYLESDIDFLHITGFSQIFGMTVKLVAQGSIVKAYFNGIFGGQVNTALTSGLAGFLATTNLS